MRSKAWQTQVILTSDNNNYRRDGNNQQWLVAKRQDDDGSKTIASLENPSAQPPAGDLAGFMEQ
jgi:hypothetical protein